MSARDLHALPPGQCIDWWRVIQDLHMHGMSVTAIAEAVYTPKSTVMGWKNLGAEPKHADGQRLLALWTSRMVGEPPVIMCEISQTDRVSKR
jgi:hypothetical protein